MKFGGLFIGFSREEKGEEEESDRLTSREKRKSQRERERERERESVCVCVCARSCARVMWFIEIIIKR